MKTLDWKELKPGDIFKAEPSKATIAAYLCGSEKYPTFYVVNADGGAIYYPYNMGKMLGVRAHLPCSKYMKASSRSLAQVPVTVLSKDEAKIDTQLLSSLVCRANTRTGSDPEIFVTNNKGRLIPAFDFLKPQVRGIGPHNPYADGFAVEFQAQSEGCHGYFIDRLRIGLQNTLTKARAYDATAKLAITNTYTIAPAMMKRATDEQLALGCAESFNAYGVPFNMPPNAREHRVRTAGGHVHLGMTMEFAKKNCTNIVKGCDLLAAIPSVAIFEVLDSPVRRQYYGRAGEYRLPNHGLEYRVLSNAWLCNPKVAHLILNLVRIGAKVGACDLTNAFDMQDEAVQEMINFCNVKEARKFVNKHLDIIHVMLARDGNLGSKKALSEIFNGGVQAAFKDFEDIESNWMLGRAWAIHSNGGAQMWGKA